MESGNDGPGTLVVAVWTDGWGIWNAARVPSLALAARRASVGSPAQSPSDQPGGFARRPDRRECGRAL